jgi:chemotaxis protein CheZ
MPVHRRRFRIEEAIVGDMPMPPEIDNGEVGPMHREIMSELRAIRAQMGRPRPQRGSRNHRRVGDARGC